MPQSDFIFATLQESTVGRVFGHFIVKMVILFCDSLNLIEGWPRPILWP